MEITRSIKMLKNYALLAGTFATGEDRVQIEELATAINAILEENKKLQATIEYLEVEVDALSDKPAQDRIEAALTLHVSFDKRGKRYCHHCDPDYDVGMVEWPCPTVKSLRGEK